MSKIKIMVILTIVALLFTMSGCISNHKSDTYLSDEMNSYQEEEKTIEKQSECEAVSRPINDFWIVRNRILALTETNELYYGTFDTASPILVASNVKDVKLLESGSDGLILLNDGKIIKVNYRGNYAGSIYISEDMNETPDCSMATYDVSADRLFDEYLFFDMQGKLRNLEGNIVFEQAVKDCYVIDYSTNHGIDFNGVFLLENGNVVHRITHNGQSEDRVIATDVAKLYITEASNFGGNTRYGSVIRNNGEVLTWMLDKYDFKTEHLNSVSKVASNANPEFDSCVSGWVYYVDNDNTLCKADVDDAEIEKIRDNILKMYYDDYGVYVIDEKYDLYEYPSGKCIMSNVKGEVTENGRF